MRHESQVAALQQAGILPFHFEVAGKMTITIEGGKHSYELEYTLPERP